MLMIQIMQIMQMVTNADYIDNIETVIKGNSDSYTAADNDADCI